MVEGPGGLGSILSQKELDFDSVSFRVLGDETKSWKGEKGERGDPHIVDLIHCKVGVRGEAELLRGNIHHDENGIRGEPLDHLVDGEI